MPASERPGRRVAFGLAGLALLASAAACTGDEAEPEATDPTSPPGSPAASSAPLKLRVDRVAGDLTPKSRKRVAGAVKDSLERYLEDAFLGDYPRTEFTLTRFTEGAERRARGDRDLLTGVAFRDAESVVAKQLKSRVEVFAPGGRPAGATAHVRFAFDVDGRAVVVRGRLLLTPQQGTWRIFGYDVASNASDAGRKKGDR